MVTIHNGEKLNDAIWRLQEEIRIIEQKKEEAERLLARLNAQERDRVRTIQLLKRKSK